MKEKKDADANDGEGFVWSGFDDETVLFLYIKKRDNGHFDWAVGCSNKLFFWISLLSLTHTPCQNALFIHPPTHPWYGIVLHPRTGTQRVETRDHKLLCPCCVFHLSASHFLKWRKVGAWGQTKSTLWLVVCPTCGASGAHSKLNCLVGSTKKPFLLQPNNHGHPWKQQTIDEALFFVFHPTLFRLRQKRINTTLPLYPWHFLLCV